MGIWALGLGVWWLSCPSVCADDASPAPIPPADIEALSAELAQGVAGASSVEVRRACKSVGRKAKVLLASAPDAPNRYDALVVLFSAQKRLLSLEMTDANRTALFDTCVALSEAPDTYAEVRLEVDLLLSERKLSESNADVAERVKALQEIVEKYRVTPAERHSLTMAAMIASKLQAFDLQKEIDSKLERSLGGDHKTIVYRRKAYSVNKLNVLFSGTYTTSDGRSIAFPFDRLGHQYLVILWSTEADGRENYELFLSRIREQQERFPDRFEVYSLNLDELPDAGSSILARKGVVDLGQSSNLTLSASERRTDDISSMRSFSSASSFSLRAILALALLTAARDTGPSCCPSSVSE